MATESKRFDVLNPVEGKDGRTHWTKIGAVFQNGGGTLSGELSLYPLNGRLVLKQAVPKSTSEEGESEE